MENGAAKDAGIQKSDIITRIEDVKVENVPQLQGQVSKYRPGDEVTVTLIREGEKKEVEVTLLNRDGTEALVKASEDKDIMASLGAELRNLPAQYRSELGLEHGVQVEEVNSGKLRKAGVRDGFIILRIDREKVASLEDIERILKKKEGKGVLIGGVYPNGVKAYYGIGA
jgi:S1-C subfamily serine protease